MANIASLAMVSKVMEKAFAAKGLVPPPRDFTKGLFKFGLIASGELPQDEDFKNNN